MSFHSMAGQWIGAFIYGPEYGEHLHNQKVSFEITLSEVNDSFEGESIDVIGIGANNQKAFIKGFVEGDFISFVKQYPVCYEIQEKGERIINSNKEHPEIHYSGNYNPATEEFSGEWEMVEMLPHGFFFQESYLTGTWHMKKAPNVT